MQLELMSLSFRKDKLTELNLTQLQSDYFNILLQEKNIQNTILFFLKQGWLVSFTEFFKLISILVSKKIILNPLFENAFLNQFDNQKIKTSLNPISTFESQSNKKSDFESQMQKIKELPFFRSLKPELIKVFMNHSKIYDVEPYTLLVKQSETDKDLFVVLSGECGVFKKNSSQERVRVATIKEGGLFGESGFLLNQIRTADVISLTKCRILKIIYLPEIFDNLIKIEIAHSLKYRFWVIHALLKSPILSSLPDSTMDQLIHKGRILEAKQNQILFRERSQGNQFYVLIQGQVLVTQNNQKLTVLQQGDCFGELALFVNKGYRTATTSTLTDCLLLEVQANALLEMFASNFFLAMEIETLAYERLNNDKKRFSQSGQ